MLKILQIGFNHTWTKNFQMFKVDLEKAEEPKIKLPTTAGSSKKQESYRKTSALLTTSKLLTVWITANWKILKDIGIWDDLTCLPWNLYAGKEAIVRTGHVKQTTFKLGKEYIRAVCCYPAHLTYMQGTSWKMPGWKKHKLESRLPEVSTISDVQITWPLWQKLKKN